MKKILLSIFVLIGLFVFVSCDNTNKNNYTSDNAIDSDNDIFNLIDSMYDEEEK